MVSPMTPDNLAAADLTCRTCPAPLKRKCAGSAHKLCRSCYLRWRKAGFPDEGPPPPARPWEHHLAARREEYAELRSWGVSVADAAERMGVSLKAAKRCEARLQAAAREAQRAA